MVMIIIQSRRRRWLVLGGGRLVLGGRWLVLRGGWLVVVGRHRVVVILLGC